MILLSQSIVYHSITVKRLYGVGKFCDFRLKSLFIWQTLQDRLMVVNRKSRWCIDPCRFRWPWVTLKGRTTGIIFFSGDWPGVFDRTPCDRQPASHPRCRSKYRDYV